MVRIGVVLVSMWAGAASAQQPSPPNMNLGAVQRVAETGRTVTMNRLGLTFSVLPPAQRKTLGVSFGLVVDSVSAAADAGQIEPGDVITAVNNTEFSTLEQFSRIVAQQKPGSSVALLVRRGSESLYVPVKVLEGG